MTGEVVFRVPSLGDPGSRAAPRAGGARSLRVGAAASTSAPAAVRRNSPSTTRTQATWLGSASGSTGCRWRSSSPPLGSVRSDRPPSPSVLTTAFDCCAPAAAWGRRGSRHWWLRSAGATSCSSPSEQLLLPPVGVRRRLRPRRRRARVRRREPRVADVADLLARLVEKSMVSFEDRWPELRYRLLETVRLYAREQLEQADEASRSRSDTRAGRGRWPSRKPARRASIARRPTCAPHTMRCSPASPARHSPLHRADAVLAAADRSRRGAPSSHADAGGCPRAHRATGGGAAVRLGDRLSLRRDGCGALHAQESYEVACELEDAVSQWRALQRLGEFAIGCDDGAEALRSSSRRSSWPNERAWPPRRSPATRSASPAGCSATWAARTSS